MINKYIVVVADPDRQEAGGVVSYHQTIRSALAVVERYNGKGVRIFEIGAEVRYREQPRFVVANPAEEGHKDVQANEV